jgi:hypothetical protein
VPEIVNRGLRAAATDQGVFDDLVEIGLARGLITSRLVRNVISSGATSRRRRY